MVDFKVYVPELPADIEGNALEEKIQTRIESVRVKVEDVKCYLQLGVAVVKLINEEDKKYLVKDVESLVLQKELGINISLVDDIELDSFIVIDRTLKKMPSTDEVAQNLAQAYGTSKVRLCEIVSDQFRNVFRIFFKKFDELIHVTNKPDFSIAGVRATVYPRADCNFLEDLPQSTNEEKIRSALAKQISEAQLAITSFYVQHNSQTGTAVVIARKSIKKWSKAGFLTIEGRDISKKSKLAYRVLVSPIAEGFNMEKLFRKKLFANRVASHKLIGDKLIIEFDELNHFNECVENGAVNLDGQLLKVEAYTAFSDPHSCEIDAFTWYETSMYDIKPDITTIMNDHQHPILHYKWNADSFIQQMENAAKTGKIVKGYDLTRHLLRVTAMLNTIGTLRKKKYVVDDQEIQLKRGKMQTIGYNNQSKLFTRKEVLESDLKLPYSSTNVKVINEDCLVLCEQLVNERRKPLVLNMANATSPGGGYRKGDGAQEENIFRRSDYYHSLDGELADKDRSERLFCTPKGDLKPLSGFANYYPMDEFGAIYTSGITVFRGTEQDGYPYKKEPLYDMCAIAMAAYRDPPLTPKNTLENKAAMNTHRKIQSVFAIGYHQKHDCLVLSALGCGAFHNPPEHVARLFKSVIYQYAGYFDTIYFAIIDDHNAGGRANPNGNYKPFKEILNDLVVRPAKTLRVDGATGPYRVLDKKSDGRFILDDAYISQLPPCQHGADCRNAKDKDHSRQFGHPPRCSYQNMTSKCDQTNDEIHMSCFIHTIKCKEGGECQNTDAEHVNDYDHPDFCQNKAHCTNMHPEHLFSYRHLPPCRDGMDCLKCLSHDSDHMKAYRHLKSNCSNDNCCSKFYDEEHLKKTIHSFRDPCPFTPYKCAMFVEFFQRGAHSKVAPDVEKHCLQYSHVCPYGRQCTTKEDKHYQTHIHIARQLCPDGNKCSKLSEENHLESYSHPNIRDIRLLCRYPGYKCKQRTDEKHLITFRHDENFDHLTVAPSSNYNSRVDFVQNQKYLIRNVNEFIRKANWKETKVLEELREWIRALQPVHRCRKEIFESILVHGHVMSRKYMEKLEQPRCVANAVLQHNQVRAVLLKNYNHAVKKNAFKLILALVMAEFSKTGADGITVLSSDHEEQLKIATNKLRLTLNDKDFKIISDWTIKIAQASVALHGAPMGIGFDVDAKMETDKHVFSILGPHCGHYYGDIVITFKQEIMFHPDSNFSVQAATSFNTGRTYTKRTWTTDPTTAEKRVEDFHRAKLHCSVPRYEYAAAIELAAVTGQNVQSMTVDLNHVLHRWKSVDSHETFEGHLPQLIPLDYVDHVYMPQNVFDSLSPNAQQTTKELFKDSLVIYPQSVNLSLIKPGGTVPLDDTRKPYLTFILDHLEQSIRERMQRPRISQGIVITIPCSNFDEHIVLPMTISQSYELYRLDNSKAPNRPEYTYIYWQAMHGDMMLTIADDKVDLKTEQPDLHCLVCYVAEKPSAATRDYRESYSYLNDDHPARHSTNVHESKFRAQSNIFYRGCNTDDFLSFCLKINYKANKATLFHAGSKGIYNHEKISYEFKKSDLDLSRIDYVHISGGNQDVPIRNLTINHEPVNEFHPDIDISFKIDTSGLLNKHVESIDYSSYAVGQRYKSDRDRKVNSNPSKQRSASAQPPPVIPPPIPQEVGFFRKIKRAIFGPKKDDNPPIVVQPQPEPDFFNVSEEEQPTNDSHDRSSKPRSSRKRTPSPNYTPSEERKLSPKHSPPRTRERSKTPPLISSKLPPCPDSIYCLSQDIREHTKEFSHPCRFNDSCQRQKDEPHLTHRHHRISRCRDDRNCAEKTNPVHRAEYRHKGLPDFLIPCRHQDACYNKSDEHREKFFHGEEIPSVKKNKSLKSRVIPKTLTKCRYGNDCRLMTDPKHTAEFSHPT